MQVNRYLKDKAMDRIDHALGRPLNPLSETYRNHYATDTDGRVAEEMRASPFWKGGKAIDCMAFFYVTEAGRQALAEHLKEIKDPHKAYVVAFGGIEMSVVATSTGKARYSAYLSASDCDDDLTFRAFQRASSVRRASS
ncbi:hypothetical protein ACT6QG_02350 [Xanthobacter sp. TB0136]|uniref:hypothetical protein n=1 Tax=Xanthobacter sp. TB0136 TaxID=3459177 RepID=UPI00403962A5